MKGQISAEMIIAIIIAMLFFVLINVFLSSQGNTNKEIKEVIELKTECNNIAGIVSGIYSSGKYTEWTGFTDKNIFFFSQGFIRTTKSGYDKNIDCFVAAKMLDSNATGNIKIFNYDGNVVIE